MQGKQAKIVSPTQERAIVGDLDTTRSPHRDRVVFLLSIKAGIRAKAMASLTWAMVTDAAGHIAEAISLQNRASKGKTGGRTMPMHPDVHAALRTLQTWCKLADSMALLLARCVSPCAGLGRANDEALTSRFHDFLGECVQPIECQETPNLGKEALQ